MSGRRALLLALGAALSGCAELATPRGPLAPPPGLLDGASDPGRAAITELDDDFRNGAARLRASPAAMARGAALLEWLAADLQSNPRWAPVAPELRQRVPAARDEVRGALGVLAGVAPLDASASLLLASRALAAGDRAAAARALPPQRFRHGGERALERLADPGPLPNSEIAFGLLAQEVARLDNDREWVVQPVPDPAYVGTRMLQMNSPGGVSY